MALRKTEKANLRSKYPIHMEIGMLISLILLLAAFRFSGKPAEIEDIGMVVQEVVEAEEIEQTKQIEKPPPPPRPPAPVEVPNDEVLDDDDLELDFELDLDEIPEDLPPPPPPMDDEEEPEIFMVVEEMPQLNGGLAALYKEIKYPEIAKRAGVEGRVVLQFIVNEQGQVVNPIVIGNKLGAGLDEEAVRAIQKVTFTPGRQRGKPVQVRMSLPVTFRLR